MNWYIEAFKKYAVFRGRARRKEYWYFVLFTMIATLVLTLVDNLIGTYDHENGIGLLSAIYALIAFLPSISVGVRRLHDTNRSGWWMLISLIPIIGPIVLLVFFVLDGHSGENQYGLNPKEM